MVWSSTVHIRRVSAILGPLASARGHTRNLLAEWGLGAFEEKVSLVVTEIVTNSLLATAKVRWEAERPPVRLWLLAGPAPDAAGTGGGAGGRERDVRAGARAIETTTGVGTDRSPFAASGLQALGLPE